MNIRDLIWIEKTNIILMLLAFAGSFLYSLSVSISLFFGFLVMKIDFWVLKKMIYRLIQNSPARAVIGILLGLKYVALFTILGIVIVYFDLHPGGLLVGVSTLVVSIVLFGAKQAWNMVLLGLE